MYILYRKTSWCAYILKVLQLINDFIFVRSVLLGDGMFVGRVLIKHLHSFRVFKVVYVVPMDIKWRNKTYHGEVRVRVMSMISPFNGISDIHAFTHADVLVILTMHLQSNSRKTIYKGDFAQDTWDSWTTFFVVNFAPLARGNK